jgi:hypothetical protein
MWRLFNLKNNIMCLYIQKESKREKADEDIVVYKVLLRYADDRGNILKTLYKKVKVELGKTYKSRLFKEKFINIHHINYGLHTFIEQPGLTKFNYNITPYVAKCIIPKGSFYYKGRFHDENFDDSYASNKLTYIEIIE